MSDKLKREPVFTEDGRNGERITQEVVGADGDKSVTKELWVEPKVEPTPKHLANRVTEYSKLMIHTRKIEMIDEASGQVMEEKIESVHPEAKMELREHVVYADSITSQDDDTDACDELPVTRGDIKNIIHMMHGCDGKHGKHDEKDCHHSEDKCCGDGTVAVQNVVKERVASKKFGSVPVIGIFCTLVIAAQVAALAYIAFGM